MKLFRPAIAFTLFFAIVLGLGFPAVIWAISQAAFRHQANGSLIKNADGQIVGSALLGQTFTSSRYFHPRPSAAGAGYDAANSSGTNLGPTSDKLINGIHDPKNPAGNYDGFKDLARKFREENLLPPDAQIPSDAVTRSASGLDPDISPATARLQVKRIALARNFSERYISSLIDEQTSGRFAGIYGEPRVNVLNLNLALDRLTTK